MIVKFFGNRGGGSAKASMDYLRGKDQEREGATVLKGDPDLSQSIAEGLEFKNNYTVGCLSFEERDLPMKEKREIMEKFEKTMFAGLEEDQYNISWIEHTDKGRLELNFYIPNVEMTTQKRLQPYYDRADRPLVDNFKKVINQEYGLTNPDAPEKSQLLKMDLTTPRSVKELKDGVNSLIVAEVAKGEIESQEQIIELFGKAGLEVTRATKRSISIKNPDGGRNIRFDGELYGKEFYEKTRTIEELREYARGEQTGESGDYQLDNERDYERNKAKLEREIERRTERNNALYPHLADYGGSLDNYYGSELVPLDMDRVASKQRLQSPKELEGSISPIRRVREIYQSREGTTGLRREGQSPVYLHEPPRQEENASLEERGRTKRHKNRGLKGFINELSKRTKNTLQGIRGKATTLAERAREIAAYMHQTKERKQRTSDRERGISDFNQAIHGLDREARNSNEHVENRKPEIQKTDRRIAQIDRQLERERNRGKDRGMSMSR